MYLIPAIFTVVFSAAALWCIDRKSYSFGLIFIVASLLAAMAMLVMVFG